MKYTRYIVLALFVYLVFNMACSKSLHKYENLPKKDFPRMVYIENEVEPLNTQVTLPGESQIYVEIRKKDGVMETGRLIRITEKDVVLSQGFYYSTVSDSTVKAESKIVISKEDILILKVW